MRAVGTYVLCHAAPPTIVDGAHNSPIGNAIIIIEQWSTAGYIIIIHSLSEVFYFPWHSTHQVLGPFRVRVSLEL